VVSEFRPVPAGEQSINTPDKANASIVAAQPLELSETDPDYAAMVVANYIFGASMDSRLFKRIREKDGLSYGVRSGLNVGFFDRVGRFSFSAIAAPQNAARVMAEFREELALALKDGFTADEVEKAKSGLLQAREVARTSDENVAFLLVTLMHENIWTKERIEFERQLASLTPQQVSDTFRRYIDPAKISTVSAGDFTKK
jgi:zinc protease